MNQSPPYPLVFAKKDDPLWGSKISHQDNLHGECYSVGDAHVGWWWLLPPSKPLPVGFKVEMGCSVEILRESTGYLCKSLEDRDPITAALPVCLLNDRSVILLPRKLDHGLFEKWSETALRAKNRGKIYNNAVPIVPSRFFRTISEKNKYRYLQKNFSQVQKQNGKPDPAYLAGTPKPLSFETKAMASAVVNRPPNYTYDAQTLFEQVLQIDGPSMKGLIASGETIQKEKNSGSKRPIDADSGTETTVVAAKATTNEPEQPPKKQRKQSKKTATAQNGRKKGGTQTENTATQNGTTQTAVTAAPPIQMQSPVVVRAAHNAFQTNTLTGPSNKQNVIHLVQAIRKHPEFVGHAKNPLSTVPVEVGCKPTDPQVRAVLLCLAQCCEYFGDDWMKEETEDDFFKNLFSGK